MLPIMNELPNFQGQYDAEDKPVCASGCHFEEINGHICAVISAGCNIHGLRSNYGERRHDGSFVVGQSVGKQNSNPMRGSE